ncbi:LacI family DNA-binding transcriptional regulator [Tropicimonas isoalkanivorans]|uniref:Transcriptional regulator, LacI family n=1 Tax=Tropicimonas isoalkanivorans TaxID=441112 RepID=A0A1I1HK36_9RHOB|nr:substrate-binding domain-containing protein [Tropicimonas isoalkanivorans]SFC24334.1 transcriptional regulator, LacI family [Tropicimonas isoalkanivorans]
MDEHASRPQTDHRRFIGAIVPDLETPFFGALVTRLENAAEAAGYRVITASSHENEEREADLVASMNDLGVAGTALVPARSERGAGPQKLRELDMQAVLVDRVSADDRYDTVTADNYAASSAAADYLLGLGHRHILLHGATRISMAVRLRLAGFVERATTIDPDVQLDELLSDGDPDTQRKAINDYLDTRRIAAATPSAVFSLSQHSTLLVFSELRRRNLQVPQEISLVGFDDADWMQATWPPITAVEQPIKTMAQKAVEVLVSRIEGRTTGAPVQHLEACTMLMRESVGPEKAASLVGGHHN